MKTETQQQKVARYSKLYREYTESRKIESISPLSQEVFNHQQKKIDILTEALKWYADPYNCTPNRDAIYCPTVNKRAWNALQKAEGDND